MLSQELVTFILGLSVLLSNIGARYILGDFTEQHRKRQRILSHPLMKYVFVFAIGFVGTRNLYLATIVTTIYASFLYFTSD